MSSTTTTRGPYAKTAKLRQRAIDAAIELFGTTGYHGATLTEVADRIGITLTGLQHHFPDKTTLLTAVLAERDRRSASQWVPADTAVGTLEDTLHILARNQDSPGLIELHCVLSAEATDESHPAHEYFRNRYETLRASAAQAFEEMAHRGELVSPLPPAMLASMFMALVDGLQVQWLLDRQSVDIEASARAYLRAIVPAMR
jgi:AcrR family transcriptional regulator